MQIGELFVKLGVKGEQTVKSALKSAKTGMSDLGSTSLATKATIIGALYALEEMTRASNTMGRELSQFHAFTGQSAEALQRYEYAGRQVGSTAEETAGSINSLVSAMAKLQTTGQMPAGLTLLSQYLGDLDVGRATKDVFYLFDKLQQFMRDAKVPIGVANEVGASFGLAQGTMAAMRKNAFRPELLNRAPIYSEHDINALTAMNAQWGDMFELWEKKLGKLNVKHGPELLKEVRALSQGFLDMADALTSVAEKFKVIETMGHVLEGVGNTAKLVSEIIDKLGGKDSKKGDILYTEPGKDMIPGFWESPVGKFLTDVYQAGKLPSVVHNYSRPQDSFFYEPPKGGGGTTVNNYHVQAYDPQGVVREIERHERRKNNNTARSSAAGQMVKR